MAKGDSYLLGRFRLLCREPRLAREWWQRALVLCRAQGLSGLWQGWRRERRQGQSPVGDERQPPLRDYQRWLADRRSRGAFFRRWLTRARSLLPSSPRFSLLLAGENLSVSYLAATLDSILGQDYPCWQLLLTLPAGLVDELRRRFGARLADNRVTLFSLGEGQGVGPAWPALLAAASGDLLAVLAPGDRLAAHALSAMAGEVRRHPRAVLLYSDEDCLDSQERRGAPNFKSDWNPLLCAGHDYLGNLAFFQLAALRRLPPAEGGADWRWSLALRLTAGVGEGEIRHLGQILYHRRRSSRAEVGADSRPAASPFPGAAPLVSLIIPTRDGLELLARCVESILQRTDYPCFELLIVDNQSVRPETLEYLAALARRPGVRILSFDAPFNYAAINNFAVRAAAGEVVAFLNNDLEVISGGWLMEMVGHALRPETGAVGALLYYPDQTIQHAGVVLGLSGSGPGGVAGHAFAGWPRGAAVAGERLSYPQYVSAVTGACLVMRRELFLAVGGFDAENLPVAFNDVDLCLRLGERGYRNVFTPRAELYHYESLSRGREDTADKQSRCGREIAFMRLRWGKLLNRDPYFPAGELHFCQWR